MKQPDEPTGQPSGACSAFGCPLPGSLSANTLGGGPWYCFCHHGQPVAANDAITSVLRQHSTVTDAVVRLRQGRLDDAWPEIVRQVKHALKVGGREDLLPQGLSASAWLSRLESELVRLTRDVGRQHRLAVREAPSSPVIGPTRAASFLPYPEDAA